MSLKDIAAAASVGRVTLYGHYESRAALVEAVVDRAIDQTDLELREVDLSGDPLAAMGRLMKVSFDLTHRFGGLVLAAQRALPPGRFQALLTIQALMHGAVEAVDGGDLTAEQARGLVPTTVLATLERRGPA